MKPQETKQIILTYSVKYPKDKTVILEYNLNINQ